MESTPFDLKSEASLITQSICDCESCEYEIKTFGLSINFPYRVPNGQAHQPTQEVGWSELLTFKFPLFYVE